jgi:hypothetical protein
MGSDSEDAEADLRVVFSPATEIVQCFRAPPLPLFLALWLLVALHPVLRLVSARATGSTTLSAVRHLFVRVCCPSHPVGKQANGRECT